VAQPPDLARKVRQLDNDVQAIYEMLASISANLLRQGNRIEEIAHVQSEQGNRIEEIAHAQSEQGATLGEQTATLTDHGSKLDRILEILQRR
jgi:phosphate uptake regulator